MRDIRDYEIKYKEEPCEKYQVQYRRKKILELIRSCKHDAVLEIGCGLEPLFEFFSDYQKMVIVEPGEQFVLNAKRKAEGLNRDITCIQGFFEDAVEQVKAAGITFDFVILSSLLHEVEEPERLLQAIYDVCADNTVVHINVPNANSLHRLLAKEMGMISDVHELSNLQKTMQRNRVFDMDSLCDMVEKCNFKVIQKGTYFPKLLSAGQMEKMLAQGIVTEDIFEGLDRMIKYLPELGSEIYVQVEKKRN
ncbi:MAG: class I SAM-dependent methyltransferase [Clostridium sp.]|nr:class I SAM-dependent methyltransferase [Clostridium sp.]